MTATAIAFTNEAVFERELHALEQRCDQASSFRYTRDRPTARLHARAARIRGRFHQQVPSGGIGGHGYDAVSVPAVTDELGAWGDICRAVILPNFEASTRTDSLPG